MDITRPYLLFLGEAHDQLAIKTALGVVDWRREWCVGQLRLPGCEADAGLPDMTLAEAARAGAKTMVVGTVSPGGVLPDAWLETLVGAVEAGLDVASGMHRKLGSIPELAGAAEAHGRALHDLRHADRAFEVGTGAKRAGKRLLTIGTDCSVGKKYAALALERDLRTAGVDADFVATGQTGVLLAGHGVAIDAVGADFISGCAEWLSPDAAPNHWHVIEGQGSLFHPAFAGVTLGLMHGSQPDALVVCHEPTRTTMRNSPYPIASIADVVELSTQLARLTNPNVEVIGVALNTAALSEEDAIDEIGRVARDHDLPACDPVRFGCDPLVERVLERWPASRAA